MSQYHLKPAIKKFIRRDIDLFGKVAECLEVSPLYLPLLLRKNAPQLTQKAVLELISKHLDLSEKELLDTVITEDVRVTVVTKKSNIRNKKIAV